MIQANRVMLAAGYVLAVDAARAIGKSNNYIRDLVKKGTLKSLRDGRALYVNVSSLIEHVADNPVLVDALRKMPLNEEDGVP